MIIAHNVGQQKAPLTVKFSADGGDADAGVKRRADGRAAAIVVLAMMWRWGVRVRVG